MQLILIIPTFFALFLMPLQASYTFKEGKFIEESHLATLSAQEHLSAAIEAYEKKAWEELLRQALIVKQNYPDSPFAQEALFFLGTAYFHLKDDELANRYLSIYLKKQATSKHFEETIHYKFEIAEHFSKGTKKHVFGLAAFPKWIPAVEDALEIYDEVVSALPHHDLGARALFGKGNLLLKEEQFSESIEAFQTLTRRFPKHPLSPESYLGIGKVYLGRCKFEYPDPDLLELATINLQKFQKTFPSEERSIELRQMIGEMEEIYARNLFETGQFFERTKKPLAALIYYKKILAKYPQTDSAKQSEKRVASIRSKHPVTKEPEVAKKQQDIPDAEPALDSITRVLSTDEAGTALQ